MKKTLRNLSIDDMLAEIKRRSRLIAKLNRRRALLLAKISDIESEIKKHGGSVKDVSVAGARSRRRLKNEKSLADSIAEVLGKDKPMTVGDIAQAVLKKGYQTTSNSFRTIVFQALIKDKRFKKAGRGLYLLK